MKKKYIEKVDCGEQHLTLMSFLRDKLAVVATAVLLVIALGALGADVFFDYDTDALGQNVAERYQLPSSQHWFGTDSYGRDLFARTLYGARYSLAFGIGCTAVSLIIGSLLGASAAYFGGAFDQWLMRFLDAFMCIPGMLLMLLMVVVLGTGLFSMSIAIIVSNVPGFTRMIRSVVLSIAEQDFVEAARVSGTKDLAIICRHIMPNAIGPIIVNGMMNIAGTIMAAAGLSYIGMGIKAPAPEWGSMLNESMQCLRAYPHVAVFPGIAITLTALCFNIIGDGLADAIDPRRRK